MAGRVMLSGIVHVKHGLECKTRLLVARCQGSVSPAKLEVFAVEGHSNSAGSKLQELSFKELKGVFVANEESNEETKKLIILQMQEGEGLKFYSTSEVEHNTWYIYCYVLANIPTYPIPDVSPHYHIPLDSFKQADDPKRFNAEGVWRVFIISEGVGKTLKCKGFHNITINRDSTLSVINPSSQVPLVTWDRDKIRRSGCLDSLVFLEAGRRCQGGPGMLWMYCPQFAVYFGECLHRFLFNKTTGDDAANFPSPLYPQNYASNSCHLEPGQDLAVNMQPSTATSLTKSSHISLNTTDSNRHHHHVCKESTRVSDSVHCSHATSSSSVSEDCSGDNEWDMSGNDHELSKSPGQYCCLDNNKNMKCDSSHKPPIIPRKAKRNKPPVPPRTLPRTFANYSEHYTMPSSQISTQTPVAEESQIVGNPMHDGHQKQTKTKETVVLRHHQRCRNMNDSDTAHIERNALQDCWVEFSERLDTGCLLPHLCAQRLLTTHDREKLNNPTITNFEKVNHLLDILPKKDGWYKKFLHCLHQSADGTGHASLAAKLKLKYEELKRFDHHTPTGSSNQELLATRMQESFPIYLESQNGSSPHTFNVTSSELVESLIDKIRKELEITCPFDITLKVDPSQKLHLRRSLRQSRVYRNSIITVVTHDSSK